MARATSSEMQVGFTPEKKKKSLNNERVIRNTFKGIVFGDALMCLKSAIEKLGLEYEEVSTIVSMGGGMPPMELPFVNHTTEHGTVIPYGAYSVKGLGRVQPGGGKEVVPELQLAVTFEKGADESNWTKLCDLIREEAKNIPSMFKGFAIRVTDQDHLVVPQYIDVTRDIPIFLNEDVYEDVNTNIFFPITNAAQLTEAGIGGYRGTLMHGKYGTGKSLVAYQTAKLSVQNGRTFVLCSIGMLRAAVEIARFLQPSTLFIEDMDGLGSDYRGLSALRNTLSGVESKKGHDMLVILTTNLLDEVEKVDRSLLRPDRVDAIVGLDIPSVDTVHKIVSYYGKDWLEETDWSDSCQEIFDASCTPAIIVEIMKRSKVVAMRRGCKVSPAILSAQLGKMEKQIELSDPKKPRSQGPAMLLAEGLRKVAHYGDIGDDNEE